MTELPTTTTRITIVGRECASLLQWMVINKADGGPDTVPGVLTRDDSSDDERNFKRRGRRSSVTSDTRF